MRTGVIAKKLGMARFFDEAVNLAVQFSQREAAGARRWPEARQIRRLNQSFESCPGSN